MEGGRTVVVQGERHQRNLAIRREDTGHVSKLCVKTLFFSENFPSYNFVAFFVSLGITISFIRKMLFSVKQEFTPAGHCFIIHLPGGGQCPLVRDSEPIRFLEIQTSPSLYILINITITIVVVIVVII